MELTDKIKKNIVMKDGFDRPDLIVKVQQCCCQDKKSQFESLLKRKKK